MHKVQKIHKGDVVKVISGNDKGKRGEVMVVNRDNERIIVKGVKIITRHQRPTARQREGGIIEREGTIHSSNVLVICPNCDTPTRVGFKFNEDGDKFRVCKQCAGEFD
jgi:large subunit ribosomal protein L24